MSNSNGKRASSVENKSKPIDLPRKLKVETAVTHKKPDLRTFNKYVTLLRDAYDKGYANRGKYEGPLLGALGHIPD